MTGRPLAAKSQIGNPKFETDDSLIRTDFHGPEIYCEQDETST